MSSVRPPKRGRRSTGPRSVVMTTRYPLDHPGGVESVARALMDSLGRTENGWRASHVAAYSGRVGTARIPLFGDLVAACRLAARIIIRKGDILLVHGAEYAWGTLAVGRLTRRPVVAVWHGVRASEALPPAKRRIGKAARRFFIWSQTLLQRAALQADATVVVSPTVAMELQSRYRFRGEVKVIPNGVAMMTARRIGHLRDDVRSSASSNGFPLRVIWVGTSAYKKGLDLAVEACKIARARGQDLSLTVVGIPVESAGVEPTSGGGWLNWLGAVPPHEMDALYCRHDILLFPTRYEACPMTVLEALAAGLPIIGSGAVQWLIEGAGEVVAGEDTSGYAEALRALAEPERRHRLALAALERARAFSWESCTAEYIEVLDVVERQRHRYRHLSKQDALSRSGAK
jgi:glycosyltransferase involved in cell wall biosynthesis